MAQTNALMQAADLVNEAMEEKGLNQTQLAKLAGVSKGYISRILSGSENMSIRNVARILHVLGKEYVQTTVVGDFISAENFELELESSEFQENHLDNGWILLSTKTDLKINSQELDVVDADEFPIAI